MVSATLILVGISAFVFFAVGGLKKASGFLGSDLVGQGQAEASGEVVVDNLQSSAQIPIPQGSLNTVNTILASKIIREPIVTKQKLNQSQFKPKIKTTFSDRKSGGLQGQFGFTVTTNSSAGKGFGLKQNEVDNIRKQPFTVQEKKDIIALQNRLNRKDPAIQKLKDSPEEVIFKKREQEAIAIKQIQGGLVKQNLNVSGFKTGVQVEFGGIDFSRIDRGLTPRGFSLGGSTSGGAFANPNFLLGGVTPEVFKQQRMDKEKIFAKQKQNMEMRAQQLASGQIIQSTIVKSGLTQKQFLQDRGFNLNTSNLSPLALGRLLGNL